MTTFIPFTPSVSSAFQFQATLDGQVYTCIVKWNVFGQRYYVEIYTLGGSLVVNIPMIGSPPGYDISLTAGYFTTKLVYRAASGQFEVIG